MTGATAPVLPYGAWPSPVTPPMVARAGLRLAEPRLRGGRLYWQEGRPEDRGRTVIVTLDDEGRTRDLVPDGFTVRSRVNEYGGGAWAVHEPDLLFVNGHDANLWSVRAGARPRLLVDDPDADFADLVVDDWRRRLLCVRERGEGQAATQDLIAVDIRRPRVQVLASGDDFYSNPCPSPDGRHLAWLSWRRPSMPWDTCTLWRAELDTDGVPGEPVAIAGTRDEAVFQPRWGPDGLLYFVSDREGQWHLYRWRDGAAEPVFRPDGELGLPRWVAGMSTWGFPDRHSVLCAVTCDGLWTLYQVPLNGRPPRRLPGDHVAIAHVDANPDDGAVWLAASATRSSHIVRWNGSDAEIAAGPPPLAVDTVSRAEPVRFPTGDGDTAHALYYPPASTAARAPADGAPPLLVKCHGGPTGAADAGLDLRIQFWTSRGFAVLDVNYRGSTGYGRAYRQKLYGGWGVTDTEDCCAGARWLVTRGLADPRRLLISGSSAGGFTVLCALTFHDLFRAGASYYGVADLASLFAITHRFEADYDRALVCTGDAGRDDLMRERSPLHHADRLRRPVIFFQGLDDRVVPPEQSRRMADAMRAAGVPAALLEFADEGHGFRRADTVSRCIAAELAFYSRVLGMPVADPLPPLDIEPPER